MSVTAAQALKAIEDAFLSYMAGDTNRGQYDRAVEYALRAWRGIKPGDYA